jgi:hypothetical protein
MYCLLLTWVSVWDSALISTVVCQMSTLYCGGGGGVRNQKQHACGMSSCYSWTPSRAVFYAPKLFSTRLATSKLATNKAIYLKTKKINKSKSCINYKNGCTRLIAASDKVDQLLAMVGGPLRLPPPLKSAPVFVIYAAGREPTAYWW